MRAQKFNAKRRTCKAGHNHASIREATRCDQLHLLQRGGKIVGLEVEPFFHFVMNGAPMFHENGRKLGYKPDFTYVENGVKVAEDVKSKATVTEAFVLRSAIFRHLFPTIDLRVLS